MNSTMTDKPKSKRPRKFAREPQGDPSVTTALTPEKRQRYSGVGTARAEAQE